MTVPRSLRLGLAAVEVLGLAAFVILLRSPLSLISAIDWDESMYALVAREIVLGHLPYVSIFQEKPLGMPLLMAAAMEIGGVTVTSVRILGSLCVIATCLLLRQAALAAGLSRFAAMIAALAYARSSIEMGGLPSNTEILFAPLTAAAVWQAIAWRDAAGIRAQARVIFVCGSLIGLAIWMKYIAAFVGCALFGLLVGAWLLRRAIGPGGVAVLAGIYAASCLFPSVAGGAYYWAIGHWDEFWFANIGFMPLYQGIPPEWINAKSHAAYFVWYGHPLLALAFLGAALWRDHPVASLGGVIWLAAEFIAFLVPWKFYDHYFLLLYPPLCLLAGAGIDAMARRLMPAGMHGGYLRIPSSGLAALAVAWVAIWPPPLSPRATRPDVPAEVARIIREDPAPGATAWMVNYEPVVYLLAGIPLATPVAFPPHLVTRYNAVAPMNPLAEVRRVLAARPRYLAIDPDRVEDILPEFSSEIFAALIRYYRPVDVRLPGVALYKLRD